MKGHNHDADNVIRMWGADRSTAVLPHDLVAERAVLGGLMVTVDAADRREKLADVLVACRAEDFYRPNHKALLELLEEMVDRGDPIGTDAVVMEAHATGRAEELGGLSYLAGLADDIPGTENLGFYGRKVRQLAANRRAVKALAGAANGLMDGSVSLEAAASAVGPALEPSGPRASRVSRLEDALSEVAAAVQSEALGDRQLYLPSGIAALDSSPHFGGLTTQGVTLVIAASGMGKTSLFNRLALGLASSGYHVMIHGTETSQRRRTRDLMFSLAGVDLRAWGVKTGIRARAKADGARQLPFEEDVSAMEARLTRAQALMESLPELTVSGAGQTVEEVCQTARRLHRAERLDALLVDYLQDFLPTPGMDPGKAAQTRHASEALKNLSADLGVPLIVAAQRANEKSQSITDKTTASDLIPQMWDVQWSSGAFQDAEEVYSLYRPDYYRDRYPDSGAAFGAPGVVYFVARKLRAGIMESYPLDFNGPAKWVGDRPWAWSFGGEVLS